MTTIEQNYRTIRQRITDACLQAARDPKDVRIVAVSKTVGTQEIEQAIALGVTDFGENRATLFKERRAAFPHQQWHFIGTIQTNKVKDFAGCAALVHSVASERALRAIDARMAMKNASSLQQEPETGEQESETDERKPETDEQEPETGERLSDKQAVLIEVNVSGEESKDGIVPAQLESLLKTASTLEHIRVDGLMTMAPVDDPVRIRASFSGLRELRDALAPRFEDTENVRLVELSMGMSEDYEIAIEEGATIIRIGRALWG